MKIKRSLSVGVATDSKSSIVSNRVEIVFTLKERIKLLLGKKIDIVINDTYSGIMAVNENNIVVIQEVKL